jgi:hypothetical protein
MVGRLVCGDVGRLIGETEAGEVRQCSEIRHRMVSWGIRGLLRPEAPARRLYIGSEIWLDDLMIASGIDVTSRGHRNNERLSATDADARLAPPMTNLARTADSEFGAGQKSLARISDRNGEVLWLT